MLGCIDGCIAPMAAAILLAAVISIVLWRQNNALRQDLPQQLKQSGENSSRS
jgi:CII-binding regulator of phage lambda lysogenization HflD